MDVDLGAAYLVEGTARVSWMNQRRHVSVPDSLRTMWCFWSL